jgi:exosortase
MEGPTYPVLDESAQKRTWIILGIVTAVLLLVFFDSLYRTANLWLKPQYQFGVIIPIIAGVMLYYRKEKFVEAPSWQLWIGAGLILFGMLVRVLSSFLTVIYLDNLALLPCLLGAFVMVGGLPTLRWAAPSILFLVFMYPFPYKVEQKLMHPLQRVAAQLSTMSLVTLGVDAVREENSIFLPNRAQAMNIAEQCSGLRMSTILTGMAVAFALFATDRPWWERAIIVISAIPIAVIVNVTRITVTGLLYTACAAMNWNDGLVDKIFHDFAGVIMILMAFGLLLLEFYILKHLVIESPDEVRPVQVSH